MIRLTENVSWINFFYLKRILKRVCYSKWKVWYKLLSSSELKKCCAFMHQISFWEAQNSVYKNDFSHVHYLVHDHWKKVSRGAYFFSVVYACTNSFNKTYKKLCARISIFPPRSIYTESHTYMFKKSIYNYLVLDLTKPDFWSGKWWTTLVNDK